MGKIYTALGLMSGTSMDGVDASIIQSDGVDQFSNILDEYCEFDEKLHKKLVDLRKSISTKADLKHFSVDLNNLEREITIFHSEIVNKISLKSPTEESDGAVILNSASIVLNAAKVIEPEGEFSILI